MAENTLQPTLSQDDIMQAEESPWYARFETYFKGDPYIWLVIFGLCTFSVLGVYSATGTLSFRAFSEGREADNYLFKHLITIFTALIAVWIAHRLDYRYYARLSRLALLVAVPLLLFTWLFGVNVNEANRWITIPLIGRTFQPSDFAKLALIANVASMLSKRQGNVDDFENTVLPILIWIGLICGLIGLANISNSILLFITCFLLMFIGRIPTRQLGILLLVGVLAIGMAMMLGQRFGTAQSRMTQFFGTEAVFQAEQANIAISTGGLVGKGPGNSDQRNFLPNPFSDFIYAIIVEEYGAIGGIVLLSLYLTLLYRGVMVVSDSHQAFGGILSAGLTFSLVLQAFLNMGVAVGILPITGVPLPMVSMGGTSLLFTGLAFGIILSVSRGEIAQDTTPQILPNTNNNTNTTINTANQNAIKED